MNSLNTPRLTDKVIFLRPLTTEDAADHLAAEDDEMAKWVSGGRSTSATVEGFIRNDQESWRNGDPRRAFGVFDCASNRLIGFIEVNLARLVEPGQVNVSYGVFPQWRRKGLALRAINLMDQYLRTATEARQIVLIAPENDASLKFAEKAGFAFRGLFDEPEGRLARYVRNINSRWTLALSSLRITPLVSGIQERPALLLIRGGNSIRMQLVWGAISRLA